VASGGSGASVARGGSSSGASEARGGSSSGAGAGKGAVSGDAGATEVTRSGGQPRSVRVSGFQRGTGGGGAMEAPRTGGQFSSEPIRGSGSGAGPELRTPADGAGGAGGGGGGVASSDPNSGDSGGRRSSGLSRGPGLFRDWGFRVPDAEGSRVSYGQFCVSRDLKRGWGSAPWCTPIPWSELRRPKRWVPRWLSLPFPEVEDPVLRSLWTWAATFSRTRATPIAASKRAAIRSSSSGTDGRTDGCKSGGYHLPSDASHQPLPWGSSFNEILLIRPKMSRPSVASNDVAASDLVGRHDDLDVRPGPLRC